MEESNTFWLEHPRKLEGIRLERVSFGVHERIKAEREIDGSIFDSVECHPIIDVVPDVLLPGEPRATLLDAVLGEINQDELVA